MEDRIRELCKRASAEKDPVQAARLLVELREALHQHMQRVRERLADYPVFTEKRARPATKKRRESNTLTSPLDET